jgi:hypothetical protein
MVFATGWATFLTVHCSDGVQINRNGLAKAFTLDGIAIAKAKVLDSISRDVSESGVQDLSWTSIYSLLAFLKLSF